MTNPIALGLAILTLAFLATDYLAFDMDMTIFLGKRLADLSEYLAFWR